MKNALAGQFRQRALQVIENYKGSGPLFCVGGQWVLFLVPSSSVCLVWEVSSEARVQVDQWASEGGIHELYRQLQLQDAEHAKNLCAKMNIANDEPWSSC
ncbi:MAG: hypothetical protein R2827_08705 [Bdellovibrionales bacterium]